MLEVLTIVLVLLLLGEVVLCNYSYPSSPYGCLSYCSAYSSYSSSSSSMKASITTVRCVFISPSSSFLPLLSTGSEFHRRLPLLSLIKKSKVRLSLPKGSNVVPFWLGPILLLGMIIYYPKRNYFGALGYSLPISNICPLVGYFGPVGALSSAPWDTAVGLAVRRPG